MGKGCSGPGRPRGALCSETEQLGPALKLGWVKLGPHRAPQVCSSIHPTPHTKFGQVASSACWGKGHLLPGGPTLLGSTPGWVDPRCKGAASHRVNRCTHHPLPRPCCPQMGGLTLSPSKLPKGDSREALGGRAFGDLSTGKEDPGGVGTKPPAEALFWLALGIVCSGFSSAPWLARAACGAQKRAASP